MRLLTTLLAIVSALVPFPALGWGQTGHRVTGEIAEEYLTRRARREIRRILPHGESLAEASTWADFMRSRREPFWREEAGPFHYVTVPQGKTYAETGAPDRGDAVVALERFARVLRNDSASREEKQLALRFAVHIIGDLHQPLHAGNGTDRGGNDFKVTYFGQPTNLHSVWDSGLINRQQLSYTEKANWLGAKISRSEAKSWSTIDPLIWIEESVAIRDTIYPNTDRISWAYGFEHQATVDRRLQMAGVRIAAWLNEVLG